uniref:Uncharacterized protein n=1 Tax=Sphaerodactylus townsendi TaxID=933632 RepID=A0ACB8F372_9SAUR
MSLNTDGKRPNKQKRTDKDQGEVQSHVKRPMSPFSSSTSFIVGVHIPNRHSRSSSSSPSLPLCILARSDIRDAVTPQAHLPMISPLCSLHPVQSNAILHGRAAPSCSRDETISFPTHPFPTPSLLIPLELTQVAEDKLLELGDTRVKRQQVFST